MTNIKNILISRRMLLSEGTPVLQDPKRKLENAYLNSFLFSNFGIIVNKPELLTKEMVKDISDIYKLNVPKSYFANPQDTKFYTADELFIEQCLSYFLAYGMEESHVHVFDKKLPDYPVGEEIKIREFKILSEEEVDKELEEITKAYATYKRPWSLDEQNEFLVLYNNGQGFYNFIDMPVLCGDNAVFMLTYDVNFAKFLFKKDVVKLSIEKAGERKELIMDTETKKFIKSIIPLVKDCPMSKKQAKYFNKLIQITGANLRKVDNKQSPNRLAIEKIKAGDIIGAADVFAKNGSLLERNIKFLLSRANPIEAAVILNMLSDKNPAVLYQLMSTINADNEEARTFSFFAKNKVKTHVETDYEARWRKSRLNDATKKLVHDICFEKIANHYKSAEKLGKVYVDSKFYRVAMPVNTSASGKGIDVPATGTRLPITGTKIRSFVHWEDAYDIDSSVVLEHSNGTLDTINYCNYSRVNYSGAARFSGDITGPKGTEYFDLDLESLKNQGINRVVFTFHGFCSTLNDGEIYCGYQNKEDFNTKAWDPKNIELKIHVKGEKRAYVAFAVDLETNEIIVLNLMRDDDSRVVSPKDFEAIKAFMDPAKLELNMGLIAEWRGEVVETPEEAEVIFSDDYQALEGQKVIRSFDVEKLNTIASI
jgi:hypothetical protein